MKILAQFVEPVVFWSWAVFCGPLILIGIIWLVATFVEGWFSRKNLVGLAGCWIALAVATHWMIRLVFHI